jgi:surface polysaccharide O-acyltransferase-like enzyme
MKPAATGAVGSDSGGPVHDLLWIVSCVASCFAFLALFCGMVRSKQPWIDSISRSAYVIYLVHYAYVLWLQRALVGSDVHAILKFLIVFFGALLFSWLTAQWLLGFAHLRKIL